MVTQKEKAQRYDRIVDDNRERQRQYAEKRKESGYKKIACYVSSEAKDLLVLTVKEQGTNQGLILSDLIIKAFSSNKKINVSANENKDTQIKQLQATIDKLVKKNKDQDKTIREQQAELDEIKSKSIETKELFDTHILQPVKKIIQQTDVSTNKVQKLKDLIMELATTEFKGKAVVFMIDMYKACYDKLTDDFANEDFQASWQKAIEALISELKIQGHYSNFTKTEQEFKEFKSHFDKEIIKVNNSHITHFTVHEEPEAISASQLESAYEQVKQQTGFSNVEIIELHKAMNCDLEALKQHIIKLKKAGKVMLTTGDWSLSNDEIRQGVIELNGKKYLLVKFFEFE